MGQRAGEFLSPNAVRRTGRDFPMKNWDAMQFRVGRTAEDVGHRAAPEALMMGRQKDESSGEGKAEAGGAVRERGPRLLL